MEVVHTLLGVLTAIAFFSLLVMSHLVQRRIKVIVQEERSNFTPWLVDRAESFEAVMVLFQYISLVGFVADAFYLATI